MLIASNMGLVFMAINLLVVAMVAGNGRTEPVSQNIVLLQKGNTSERREAAAILARLGDRRAVHPLTQALHDPDQLVRQAAEDALWRLWQHSGKPEIDARLQDGIERMQHGNFTQAVAIFTEVIDMAPDFAEAYNKRATTYYLMQAYRKSIRDCEKTIQLNPVHFGALSGTGLNYLGLRNFAKALEYFERAVVVNPNMPQIRAYIQAIKTYFRDQSL